MNTTKEWVSIPTFQSGLLAVICIITWNCPAQTPGQWTWMKGSNTVNPPGVYGTQGVPDVANTPPGLYEVCEWKDNNGNFWIFGGASNTGTNIHAALWKYDPIINQWTWMKGPSTLGQFPVFGTQGVPDAANHPGSIGYGIASWTDASGNLWLFGGYGFGIVGSSNICCGEGFLNNLWKYDISTNEWTWMKGSGIIDNLGSYGTLGVSNSTNLPPSRSEISGHWTDNAGNLWLYGGGNGSYGDLWKYNISTNEWTWMHGANTFNPPAVYGTKGVANAANTPGGKFVYASWTDLTGDLWLLGCGPNFTYKNDLWKYNISTNQWTWMKGSNTVNDVGSYGTKCVSANSNEPPARLENRARVRDACGNFWNFGGYGQGGDLNDLWHYNISTNQWTWVSGANTYGQSGVYGTKGVSAPNNRPMAKQGSVAWIDNNGYIWVFGGGFAYMNDLFRYVPNPACVPVCASLLSATATVSNVLCNGQCNGSATVTANNGTTPYTYSWTGGQTTQTATGLCAGTYTVTVTDAVPTTVIVAVTITQPTLLTATANAAICNGDSMFLQGSYQTITGIYYDTLTSIAGCDSIITTALTAASPIVINITSNICQGDSIFLQGNYQNTAGAYYDTLTASAGCDSIIQTTISVNTSYNIPLSTSICTGDSIFLQGSYQTTAGTYYDTLTAANGCDSILATTLSVNNNFTIPFTANICSGDSIFLQGNYQTAAGTYYDTLAASNGCDSILATTLTVPAAIILTLSSTDATCGNADGSASVAASGGTGGYSYLWSNGQTTINATGLGAGSYAVTATDSSSCEQTATVNISNAGPPDATISSLTNVTCNGGNNGSATVSATGGSLPYSYLWSPAGGTDSTATGLQAGTYTVTITDSAGCIEIVDTSISEPPLIQNSTAANICTGDSIFLQGAWQSTAGTYYDTLSASGGCDSILTTTLSVNNNIPIPLTASICTGDSIQLPGGNWANSAGVYSDTLTASAGCDSIVQTNLTVNTSYNIPLNASICTGDSIFLQGNYQSTAGTYYDTLSAANGCDSILATTLSVDSAIFNSVAISICPGDSIQLPSGNWANSAGVYYDTLTAGAGCDSIVQTTLSLNSTYNIPLTASICTGDSIFLQGNYQTAAGNYYDTLTSVNGCDSILATALSVNSSIFYSISNSICPGDSIQLPGGNWANTAGVYYDTLTAGPGCDSIVQIILSVNTSYNIPLTASICSGDSIFLQGNYQTTAGTYYDTLTSANGCDSILATALSVNSSIFYSISNSICPGDSIQLPGGNWANTAGVYYDTLTAGAGCDSIIQTNLSVNTSYNIPLTASICTGDSIFLQGNYQSTAGTYYDTLTAANGCDSIIQTTLSVNTSYNISLNASICTGDSIFLQGSYQTIAGTYSDTLSSALGECDSIKTTTLTVNPVSSIQYPVSICSGDSVFISGVWIKGTGTYYDSLLTASGCDSIIAINLSIDSIPVVTVGQDTTITAGATLQIIASGGISYLWSNGETSSGITVSPQESTTYYVTVSDANGCAVTDSVKITVDISKCTVFVPTIFTPNGDGKNDMLFVRGYGLKELEFMIYDRWGEKVFEMTDKGLGWDGTFQKKEMNTAVFVYMLKAVCFNNELIEEKGNITLVK